MQKVSEMSEKLRAVLHLLGSHYISCQFNKDVLDCGYPTISMLMSYLELCMFCKGKDIDDFEVDDDNDYDNAAINLSKKVFFVPKGTLA